MTDSHPPSNQPASDLPPAHRNNIVLVLSSFIVIVLAVQIWLAQQDDAARDREQERQDHRDRAYAECLSQFASELVEALERRTSAATAVERAEERKDAALDSLLSITELSRRRPPKATAAEFDQALRARVAAQEQYERVRSQQRATRRQFDFQNPEVVCER